MTDTNIMATLAFVAALVSIVAPVLKLNSNIVKLNANFESMKENDITRDKRIDRHGKEIDELRERQRANERILSEHGIRIKNIEGKM